jgi:hypothetical protein
MMDLQVRILSEGYFRENLSYIDATLAGIKDNDRLIEINGQNIEDLDHGQVKQRFNSIKYPTLVQLLVTDVITYDYYKHQDKVIHHNLPTVKSMSSSRMYFVFIIKIFRNHRDVFIVNQTQNMNPTKMIMINSMMKIVISA